PRRPPLLPARRTRSRALSSPPVLSSSPPAHRRLHSFPTRRSSDLTPLAPAHGGRARHLLVSPQCAQCFLGEGSGDAFGAEQVARDRKSTRLNSSHLGISYAVFCLKKKTGSDARERRRVR